MWTANIFLLSWNVSLVQILSICCLWDFRISRIWPFGLCLKLPLLYRGSDCRWNTAVDIKTGKRETFVLYQWADKLGITEMGDRLFWRAPGSRKPSWNKQFSFLRWLDEEMVVILIRWGLPNHRAERKTRGRKTIPSDIRGKAAAEI